MNKKKVHTLVNGSKIVKNTLIVGFMWMFSVKLQQAERKEIFKWGKLFIQKVLMNFCNYTYKIYCFHY